MRLQRAVRTIRDSPGEYRDVPDAITWPSQLRKSSEMVRSTRCAAVIAGLQCVVLAALAGGPLPVLAAEPGNAAVVAENLLPGSPAAEWDVVAGDDPSIQGFTTDMSTNRGGSLHFKIRTAALHYQVRIYRIGFYGGAGARRVAEIDVDNEPVLEQPACITEPATGLIDCGSWQIAASWRVPETAQSGVYVAKLVRGDTRGASHILFVVRDDKSTSDILLQTSDTTWQAYNDYGGRSLYVGSPAGRAYKVSYNRPMVLRGRKYGRASFWANEYPMIRWLEANGYDVTYTTGVDTARHGELLKRHRVFMSVGHDEYWSGEQRLHVETARDAGVHLAFFSGNSVFWKTRWEPSVDASLAPYRTLVCYKESLNGEKIDPSTIATGTWRDPRFSLTGNSVRPENALKGSLFVANCCRFDAITVSAEQGRHRFWRHTTVASLAPGQSAVLGPRTVGYEWDGDVDNGFRPPGLMRLSSTTLNIDSHLLDFGSKYGSGTATHSLTLFKHPSGSLVFSAGTIVWAWALDAVHDDPDAQKAVPDERMQQATVNLLADMGVRPGSPLNGLVVSDGSPDSVPPVAIIASPKPLQEVEYDLPVVIAGTTRDDAGVPASVEVSTDGGASWHPATGIERWTYEYTPRARGYVSVLVRATADSGNIGPVASTVVINVRGLGRPIKAAALVFVAFAFVAAVTIWFQWRRQYRRRLQNQPGFSISSVRKIPRVSV